MNQQTPTSPQAAELSRRAHAMAAGGQRKEAADMLLEAANEPNADGAFLEELGRTLEELQQIGAAVKVYRRALLADPDLFITHARLGSLYFAQGQITAAIFHMEKAHEIKPDDPGVLNNLGLLYQANREFDRAITTLKEALEKGGPEDLIVGTLAGLYEETNRLDELAPVLEQALTKFPDDFYLNFVSAKMKRREGKPEEALAHLEKFDPARETNDAQVVYHFEMGRNLDLLKDYDRAFAHFERGNRLCLNEPAFRRFDKKESRENIRRLRGLDLSNWQKRKAKAGGAGERPPVFLVGFPRSGTTLLAQILDSHPEIETIEEQPTLIQAIAEAAEEGEYPAVFTTLDENKITHLRAVYLDAVDTLRQKGQAPQVVDKFPLQILEVPLIVKLFPNAKIILALRHPCDTVISCFMQNFGPNNAMLNFLNLDDATSYYAEVMGLWLHYRKHLNLNVHEVRYERVVKNLEKEAKDLIAFLGLPWDGKVLDYREQARTKAHINTPSYHQVIKPIYRESVDRWKNYETCLKPYFQRLQPAAEAFGYSLQPDGS